MRTLIASTLISVVAFAPLGACSGGSVAVTEPVTSDVEGGVESAPAVAGAFPDAATATDVATKRDVAIDAAPDTRIDPIDLGRTWTYDVAIIGTYPLCKPGSNTGRVLGQKVVAGKQAFQVQSFCPGAGTSSYAVDGDKVEIYYGNAWILALDAPVAEGHTWTDGVVTYVWEEVGELTVPAGTYDDCWNARPLLGPSYTIFCRGIGPVRWHYVDGLGNGYDATLTATTP